MTNATLRGKPYAGNPHVRFDEGEVAPAATPRRGSLLYKALRGTILAAAAALVAVAVFADTDVYGNEIRYENDGVTVKYRFWYGSETAETKSVADAVSANASPSVDFEPRYLTWAVSDGKCPVRGICIVVF